MKAIIVGGGIGGLASALALTERGWQVEVLERAPEFTEAGAGLSLWPNALRALDALGVGEPVRGRAALEGQAGIRDTAGRWLSRTDTAGLERRYGPVAMIHRADLLAVLLAAMPDGALRPGTTVTGVQPEGTVLHSGGQSRADLVVGADGMRSITRRSVWPDAPGPRYAGYTTWRMVTAPVPVAESSESWGRGSGSATSRSRTGGSTASRRPTPPKAPGMTGWPGCAAGSAAGTTRSRRSWLRPSPAACCTTTCTSCRR